MNSLVTFLKHIDKCGTSSSEMMLRAYNLLVLCSQQAFKHNIGRLNEWPPWRPEMPRILE